MFTFEIVQGLILTTILITVPATLLVSWGLLALYRRALVRWMKSGSLVKEIPTDTEPLPIPTSQLSIVELAAETPMQQKPTESKLSQYVLRGPWREAMVYTLALSGCRVFLSCRCVERSLGAAGETLRCNRDGFAQFLCTKHGLYF